MPPWPAEEFLRELVVFSEKHTDWAAAEVILNDRVKERLATKKTKKQAVVQGENGEGSAGHIPSLSLSSSSSVYIVAQENADLDGAVEGLPNFDAVVDEHWSISHESSPPSIEPQTESAQNSAPSSDENVKGSKSQKVASGKAKEVEVIIPRKRNRRADQRISKRKKFWVEIPIINLDEDALAVEEAVKVLFQGQWRPGKEMATRMLEKIIKMMRAKVVEIEDD
ncbi:hypothetical protein EV426DRAFT_702726 [Tirmania nivea]|nr:hypothetical protein EV426DRAFT_702726 [Tirmania nivea]